MRVRMLSARGGYPCGVVCDVPDDLARAWCADKTAEPVDPPAPETAMRVPAAETTMLPKPRGRRGRV